MSHLSGPARVGVRRLRLCVCVNFFGACLVSLLFKVLLKARQFTSRSPFGVTEVDLSGPQERVVDRDTQSESESEKEREREGGGTQGGGNGVRGPNQNRGLGLVFAMEGRVCFGSLHDGYPGCAEVV